MKILSRTLDQLSLAAQRQNPNICPAGDGSGRAGKLQKGPKLAPSSMPTTSPTSISPFTRAGANRRNAMQIRQSVLGRQPLPGKCRRRIPSWIRTTSSSPRWTPIPAGTKITSPPSLITSPPSEDRHRTFWQAPIRYHGNIWQVNPLMRIINTYATAFRTGLPGGALVDGHADVFLFAQF